MWLPLIVISYEKLSQLHIAYVWMNGLSTSHSSLHYNWDIMDALCGKDLKVIFMWLYTTLLVSTVTIAVWCTSVIWGTIPLRTALIHLLEQNSHLFLHFWPIQSTTECCLKLSQLHNNMKYVLINYVFEVFEVEV